MAVYHIYKDPRNDIELNTAHPMKKPISGLTPGFLVFTPQPEPDNNNAKKREKRL
tara:strand:- start:2817 stop:2981 length:165 start_codon:yes stop_codon:yes gene_type:complete